MTRLDRFRGSLLARLALGYVLIAAVFAGAWLWSLYGPLTQAALRQQQRNLTAVAQSAALVAAQSSASPAEIAKQLVARTDLRLTIIDSDGTVLADSNFDPTQMENHLDRPEVTAALEGEVGTARRLSRTVDIEELYVAVPASVDGRRVALRVSQPLAEIESIAARSRSVGLVLLGASLLIAVGIAVRVTREVARPIESLSGVASRMAEGNLATEVPSVPTDLEDLAGALGDLRNQVSARLAALDAERATLRATLDGLPDAVFVFDDGAIVLANQAADAIFSTPSGGWEGTALEESGLPWALQDAIRAGITGPGAGARDLDADPTGRTLRVVVAPLRGPGATSRTIVSVSDVTERARLDAVRRDFVANASHELKTPVAGIQLLAQSVETAAQDGDVEQALAFARQIEQETDRLRRLVGDLLDLSRLDTAPEAGAITDVRRAVDTAILSHRTAATRRGLQLEADFSDVSTQDVFASADPTDLAIALDNLLDNAIAYTEAGSVTVAVRADDHSVKISVSDTGPGIPPEHQPRIFERFYRIDRARTRDSGGTGLGLALVKHVTERSGGAIDLESVSGEGSTFTLSLPRAR